jgi:ABC-type uncharacterized transport system involved in gliding motility auxiliary subunit
MSFEKMKDSAKDFKWGSVAPYLLGIGIICLVGALVAYLVRGAFDPYTYIPLLIGVVGVLSFAFLDPDRVQSWIGSRQARYGTNLAITALSLTAIVVLVNYIIYRASSETNLWVDLTEKQTNTLKPETIRTLHTLQDPIEIRAYFTASNNSWETAMTLLDKYVGEAHGLITYEKIDPEAEPLLARADDVTRDGTLVLALGTQKEPVTTVSENEITTAIYRLMNPGEHRIFFLTGHGEAAIGGTDDSGISTLVGLLRAKNYTVETLDLTKEAKVPEGTQVLVIAGPKQPLQDVELTAVKDYLKAGGGLILLQNPYAVTQMDPSKDVLAQYLRTDWGITLRNDIVVDLLNQYVLIPFTSTYPTESPITSRIPSNRQSVFPTAMSIQSDTPEDKIFTPIPFVQIAASFERVWGETDLTSVGEINLLAEAKSAVYDKEKDNSAPLDIAVSAEDTSISSRVVVFGDEDFAENQMVNYGSGVNGDLIVNAVDWASQQENLISLTPEDTTYRYIEIPEDAWVLNAIVLTSTCLLPGSFVLMYGIVWYNRRKHK